jgi:hypothetical protein
LSETTVGVPRTATRVRLVLPELDHAVVQRALEHGIRHAIEDPAAVVDWYPADGGEGAVITVKQQHATWWTMMPAGFFEMIGGYFGTTALRWRDDEPPEALDDW